MVNAQERQEKLNLRRSEVGIEHDRVTDVSSTDFPGHYPGVDDSWNLERFKEQFSTKIYRNEDQFLEFDMIGVDASIANAIRRILISEIPTMAIEYVYVLNNTSVVQDEILAQRLGLVPIRANPDYFRWFKKPGPGEDANPTDFDTIVLELNVECTRKENVPEGTEDPKKLYNYGDVMSGDIVWTAQGVQAEWFKDDPIRAVQDDILIAKLRPGQQIHIQMHCILGIAQDHAKFSPVCPASYRILPTIHITSPITGEDAVKFSKCFPKGVIRVEGKGDERNAVVRNPRNDTVSRECLRHDEFKNKVRLGRKRDHFIFNVESTGSLASDELVLKSIAILKEKCLVVKKALETSRMSD